MSDSADLWSDNPNAPHITKYGYRAEKTTLAGSLISSILYGMVIILFFQCMAALLSPVHRRGEGIKWWLVFYTVAMFSFVTVYTSINLHIQSISFIDNRELVVSGPLVSGPNTSRPLASGPLAYQVDIRQTTLGLIPNVMFSSNNWLADGLLIYRCYIIYSSNLWVIALPCLMYIGSLGMGFMMLWFQTRGYVGNAPVYPYFGALYFSISVSLNVLLTLMIVIRLVLHGKSVRAATGSPVGVGGLYKAISTMLIESCALFTVSSLLVVGALATILIYNRGDEVVNIFYPILAETQVIAPLLIIQRVANRSALTSHAITTGRASSVKFRKQGEMTDNDGTPLGGRLTSSASGYGNNSDERGVVVGTTVDSHLDGKA